MTTDLSNNWLLPVNGAIEPLVDISGVRFANFVQMNEDVTVSGSLTDIKILEGTDTNEKSQDEDDFDISQPLPGVSVKDQKFYSIPWLLPPKRK